MISDPPPGSLRTVYPAAVALITMMFAAPGFGQQLKRKKINLAHVEELAREAASRPFRPPSEIRPLPRSLQELDYSRYRSIHTHPDKIPWKPENLNFLLHFFHPGYLYRDTVVLHEFTGTHVQRIRFMDDLFEYGHSGVDGRKLPDDLGYAGFRLNFPLSGPDSWDEFAVFQGASYYRLVAKDQVYGLSARGLGINCGRTDVPEEFPYFTQFWIGKPTGKSRSIQIFALLESHSVTGAYEFNLSPGTETVADVRATLFFRRLPESICLAPLTSMFWFGENTTRKPDDFRPEIHDSDGMVLRTAAGECLWRPISTDSTRSHFNTYTVDGIQGFGLLQRDRSIRAYQDAEARYHRRPNVWIEPVGDWGRGRVVLLELPAKDETDDNIVAYWEPEEKPELNQAHRIHYLQRWTGNSNPARAGAVTRATRTGLLPWRPGERFVVVDFHGKALSALESNPDPPPVTAHVESLDPEVAEIADVTVHHVEDLKVWRLTFYVRPPGFTRPDGLPDQLLAPDLSRAAELRAYLKSNNDILSETWTYRIDP